jgi:hypothetical protein
MYHTQYLISNRTLNNMRWWQYHNVYDIYDCKNELAEMVFHNNLFRIYMFIEEEMLAGY